MQIYWGLRESEGNVASHDNKIALGQVLNIHNSPDQCQSIGGKCENRTNQQSIQKKLKIQHRNQTQKA